MRVIRRTGNRSASGLLPVGERSPSWLALLRDDLVDLYAHSTSSASGEAENGRLRSILGPQVEQGDCMVGTWAAIFSDATAGDLPALATKQKCAMHDVRRGLGESPLIQRHVGNVAMHETYVCRCSV